MNKKISGFFIIFILSISIALLVPPSHMQANPLPDLGSYQYGIEEKYWQQDVHYWIDVTLDTKSHILSGKEKLLYRNNSPDTLDRIYMHLYPNAYRDKAPQMVKDFMKETLIFLVGLSEEMRSWIEIESFAVNGDTVRFDVNGTILECELKELLLPGDSLSIEISFKEKIRRRVGRAGYMGRHYDLAQWYPKMVVYDKNGWHPDQFRIGEFYGEFATYNVSISLPEDYVVVATGVPVSGDPGWDRARMEAGGPISKHAKQQMARWGKHKTDRKRGTTPTKKVTFHAENVHDFAIVADPTFIMQDTLYSNVDIKVFYRIWNHSWQDSVLARTIRTVRWLEEIAGPFPYRHLYVVDCPTMGGMEYPMLVMNGGAEESLIMHEVGHQYFYGALANDERAEAWLDEGFTQYQTFWYEEKHFGPYGRKKEKIPFPMSLFPTEKMWEGLAGSIIDLKRRGFDERISTPAHELENYTLMSYVKAPLFLRALKFRVGEETFEKILKTYYERWKFKHVDEESFKSICEELSSLDLDEFFRQWLHTTKDCDYSIKNFKVKKLEDGYIAKVKIERKGDAIMPLTLAFKLKNGNTAIDTLNGFLRTIEKDFRFEVEPVSVAINPDNEILDIYMLDNFYPRRRRLSLDVPFNTYYPDDAFDYRIIPIVFYNKVDGVKLGMRLRSSYDNFYKRFTLQSLYNLKSKTVDFYTKFENPAGYFGRDASFMMEGYKREGRQGATIKLNKILRKSLRDGLAKHLSFYLTYDELRDSSYVFEKTYSKGANFKGGLSISMFPKTDVFSSSIKLSLERSVWGSDFNYERFILDTRLKPSRYYFLPLKLSLRFFYGHSSIDPSMQERFHLAQAGVREKEKHFWLRSRGAFPNNYYNNFYVPGDGNLRGYYNADFAFKKLFASNLELDIPLTPKKRGMRGMGMFSPPRLFLFFDWGKVLDERPEDALPTWARSYIKDDVFDHIIYNFGVGFKLSKLSVQFPIYLSNPSISEEEEKWKFRWIVGFDSLF